MLQDGSVKTPDLGGNATTNNSVVHQNVDYYEEGGFKLAVIEAMKMENILIASQDGVVAEVAAVLDTLGVPRQDVPPPGARSRG